VLERIGGFKGIRVSPAVGGKDRYTYRNKMEFSFGTRWLTREEIESDGGSAQPDRFALGLHVRGRYDKVLDLQECFLGSAKSYKIMDSVRLFCRTRDLPVYSPETGSGYLRNLVVRESQRTGDTMVNVVTFDDRPEVMAELRDWLVRDIPGITTLVNNITARKSQVAIGETEKVYLGPGFITEILGGKRYHISANSFFQTNTAQAEVVYETAKRFASLTRSDLVFDLYSGTGGIALFVADNAAEVIGIESVEAAVHDAQRNAALNNVTNCTFVLADAKDSLASYADWRGNPRKPRVVILDPPRSGLHPKIIRSLREAVPERIVYVSCNPATQARDLKLLSGDGSYCISDIQPVDMFPHTDHIENVVCLVSNR
jgi:23S rRNA (uracil1939-C5)-methyltransferase